MIDDLESMEESLRTTITKQDVEARIRDWKDRLDNLFREIAAWAVKNGWQVNGSGTVGMDEELMNEFDIPATTQPTLRLDGDRGYALFKPKGLWVIGANGRIDLYTSKGTFILVDLAERGHSPQWTIFRATENRNGDLFVPDMLESLI